MSLIQFVDVGRTLERATKLLAGIAGGVDKAVSSALRRAGSGAKTKGSAFATAEYTIGKGTFTKNVDMKSVFRAGGGSGSMSITYAGQVLPSKSIRQAHLEMQGLQFK